MSLKSVLSGSATAALLTLGALLPQAYAAEEDRALEHARRLLKQTILIDGHNDLPWAIRNYKEAPGDVVAYDLRKRTSDQTDLARLREGGIGAQFWSVYIQGEAGQGYARTQLEQIELALRI